MVQEHIEIERRQAKIPIGTVEYAERHLSAWSLVVMILVLSSFFFSFFFYLQNKEPLLLVVIILCLQTFYKFLDNVPSKIWKLYSNSHEKE